MDNQMRERLWSLEKKQFEERREQIDLINRKCHDLKHQIAALEYISDRQEYKNSIQELKDAVQMYDDGLPVSTKEDDGYHGFGMKNIRQIVEKYNGAVTIDAENGNFMLKILIPVHP